MKRVIIPLLLAFVLATFFLFSGCGNTAEKETTAAVTTTEKVPGKYADSEYLGAWYNADSPEKTLICKLNDDGTAKFKNDKKAKWTETDSGITITAKVDGKKTTMEGYFVIVGDGYAARKTEENMHYLDEGGEVQLEIMLTETTCVDCVKK